MANSISQDVFDSGSVSFVRRYGLSREVIIYQHYVSAVIYALSQQEQRRVTKLYDLPAYHLCSCGFAAQ